MSHTAGYLLQQMLNAVQLASFYLPLALAFAIMQAITGRIFLAFGDIAMFASFAAVYSCFDSLLQGNGDVLSAVWSLAAAIAGGAALGATCARVFLGENLLRSPLAYMIASVGLAIALQETMRIQSQSRDVWVPPLFGGQYLVDIPGAYTVRLATMPTISAAVSLLAVVGGGVLSQPLHLRPVVAGNGTVAAPRHVDRRQRHGCRRCQFCHGRWVGRCDGMDVGDFLWRR